ncbi:metal-dependent hydrolase [Halospeciosus flavus]|uniref:Metal-dependent hydrolase n=1 Tax=Halospeciosus flavus TaxID=3032283 RepID=A0ABD5Z9B9_9EURY|nr:metal-dependent hydrolase [Halospeciosus flavus]
MPSELVHLAFAGYLAAALLGPAFSTRTVAVVLAAAAIPDVDSVLAIWLPGTHRALLHTLLLPLVLGVLLAADLRREDSVVRPLFDGHGLRVAAVALGALTLGGIAPDLFTNGVNLFYPFHDRFYTLNGDLSLSTTRGVVQTFVEFHEGGGRTAGGTTESTFYYTGIDTDRGADPRNAERVFPLVSSGMQLLVVATSALVLWGRFRDANRQR